MGPDTAYRPAMSSVPNSFLFGLEATKPPSNVGSMVRGDGPKPALVKNAVPLESLAADQKAFLDSLAPVPMKRRWRGGSVSPVRHRAPVPENYSGDGLKQLNLLPAMEGLNDSAKSVYDRRRSVLREVEHSKMASQGISLMFEKSAMLGHKQQAALQKLFDTLAVPDEDDLDGGQRKRPQKPLQLSASPHLHLPSDPLAINDEGDSIDMFLLTKAMTIPPGQKIVSDLVGGVMDPDPPPSQTNLGGKQADNTSWGHPQLLPSDVPPPGSNSEAALDERIGQFGGLIPTLYTMDNLDRKAKRVQNLPNRFHTQVVARDTKVTGAGFRRRAPTARHRSFVAGEEYSTMSPEPSAQDVDEPPPQEQSPTGRRHTRNSTLSKPNSAHQLEQEGALIYHTSM
mmetsp:Transcript_19093/g.53208  ORF Transcript_19093/g.53208 Transcript_19093/m.53208 type:complete len:397 (+) Transcript_19093:410-1600(+)|eukprot:CAMPEP_0117660552 /NCGR_PEP_ID=MMETSP0804-20121206/7029_1 /TAXON_ID=1074897 /ORGANISM="Tetraselmis astigmatica, Strain CCMP880" /LENGTH=396 /DNA_ID=CAMNT_0005467289 /DNA_START=347 /DNA_END=1537 /DNA_ORIENTATION=+